MSRLVRFFTTAVLFLSLFLTANAREISNSDIVILFDNDVHGRMEGYSKMAALRKDMLRSTPEVCVVSLGDFAQGGPLCSISHGQYAIDMMNRVGYDFVALGNHEYDFGLEQLDNFVSSLHAKTLVCNFMSLATNEAVYPGYAVRKFGNVKVGFVGVVTPVTKTSDAPHSFLDADGNDLYSFCPENLSEVVQANVDKCRELGADYVILLAHLGDKDYGVGASSEEVIHRTHGIDVVLDGHAHLCWPGSMVANAKGDSVLLCSSGYYFQNIGRVVISANGTIKSDLISLKEYTHSEGDVDQLLASFMSSFDKLPTLATSKFDLAGFDEQHDTWDRNCQTNLGTLCADAFRVMSNADIGWINAGGIRGSIPAGRISYKELLGALPFENQVCVCEFTGQQVLDALEFGVRDAPADNGGYPQVSGITFDIDLSAKVTFRNGESERFAGIAGGSRRLSNVRVLNRATQQFEPIDPAKIYTIASINYMLKNHGCNGMLDNGRLVGDDRMIDTQLLEDFISRHLNGVITDNYRKVKRMSLTADN